MEAWLACETERGEKVLYSDHCFYIPRDGIKFLWHQSDESVGMGRDRAGILDPVPHAAGDADHEQPKDHGAVGKFAGNEYSGLGNDGSDLCGSCGAGDCDLVLAIGLNAMHHVSSQQRT